MSCTLALGTDYKTGFGGKGANQCIMAAKLGVTTAMVGALSTDANVKATRENFRL
jgi:ribokinase